MSGLSRREVTLAEAMDHGHTRTIAASDTWDHEQVVTFTDGSRIIVEMRPGRGGGCDTCGWGADEGDLHIYLEEPA